MINQGNDFVSFQETRAMLYRLCVQRRSGVMRFVTDQGKSGVFSLARGSIFSVRYGHEQGLKAVNLLRDDAKYLIQCKHEFKFSPEFRSRSKDIAEGLPADNVILGLLGVQIQPEHFWLVGTKAKKILIIDDSGLSRKVLQSVFRFEDYDVTEAVDGFDAMDKLAENTPDLVLLDLILPKTDGYQVLDAMKANSIYKNIPVIMLTSRDTLMDEMKGKMSASDAYLTKPVNPEELRTKVKMYLDNE